MMAAIAGQPHPDVTNFMKRVVAGSGAVRAPIQIALDEFIKKCYLLGVRSRTGGTHQLRMVYIPCTDGFTTGTYEKLWFPVGNQTAMSIPTGGGTITYSESVGMTVLGITNYVDSRLAANNGMTINSCMMFLHNLTAASNQDYVGANDAAAGASTTNVFLINPKWTDGLLYFDVGNSTATTAGGRISAALPNNVGLILGYKSSATQAVYVRGSLLVSRSNAPTAGLTMSTDTITAMYGRSGTYTARNIGGVGSGTPMAIGNISPFTTAWNNLQAAMGRATV